MVVQDRKGGMVFTRATRWRWETVTDALCEIVQRILEVDSLDDEVVREWHWELCRFMEYPSANLLS